MKLMVRSLALVLLFPALGWACIWDSDTLQDELQGRSSAFHVISGQVPEHGRAYYEKRLERSLELLARASQSIEVLYDVAGAYMRLGEQDKAIEMLEKADAIAPDRYKTHSNLGVAYYLKAGATGSQGDYESARKHTAVALGKRRDAHFGAGWLFEKVIEYKLAGAPKAQTFLGTEYNSWKASLRRLHTERAKKVGVELAQDTDHIKPLLTLLRSHPDFSDGYLVLALNLHNEWNLNLALWAYVRALDMGHPRKDVINAKIDQIFGHWKEVFKLRQQKRGQRLMTKDATLAVIRKELAKGALWRSRFVEMETALLQKTGDLPDFNAVTKALEAKGVKRGGPAPAGLVGGEKGTHAGEPTRSAHAEKQQSANGPAKHPKAKAPRELRARDAQGPAPDGAPSPAQSTPPVGGETTDTPPMMDAGPPPADVSYLGAESPGSDAAAPASGSDAPAQAPAEQGLPWFVIFGFAMLAVCLAVVVMGRGRRA